MMVQQNKCSRLQPVQIICIKKNWGTLKRPGYQPGTASAVLMKYLVKSDTERQAESPVDPSEAFFNSTAATVKMSSPLSSNHLQVKNICDCICSRNDRNFTRSQVYIFIRIFFWLSRWTWDTTKPCLWCKFCFSPGVRICATEFVCIVQFGYMLSTVYFSIKYVINFALFLAAVCVCFATSINVFE